MDKSAALKFLRKNQPMPPDVSLTQDLIDAYDEARRFFLDNPAEESIPLFLNSFGDGMGLGVYQLVEDVIARHPSETVVPYLKTSLRSDKPSVRYWSAQIAATVASPQLVPELGQLLNDAGPDIRESAIIALERIDDDRVTQLLRERLAVETDDAVRKLIMDILE